MGEGTQIFSKELVQERIDKYIEDNKETIIEMIDKKIDGKVKTAVREIFLNGWRTTEASKIIKGKIETEIELVAKNITIDSDVIAEAVDRKIKTAVKNIEVTIKN